jgi:excisionase family DNA binding protein
MVNLRSLPSDEPATSIGWVRWIWPEIENALATGKKLKEVWEAAQQDGLQVSYAQFRVYVSRIRRKQQLRTSPFLSPQVLPQIQTTATDSSITEQTPRDPLYNIRVQLEKKRQSHFEYNPFPDPKYRSGCPVQPAAQGRYVRAHCSDFSPLTLYLWREKSMSAGLALSPFEPLLDTQRAAALLGIHPKTLQKLARAGTVPCHRIGDLWRFRASELDTWLRTGINSKPPLVP